MKNLYLLISLIAVIGLYTGHAVTNKKMTDQNRKVICKDIKGNAHEVATNQLSFRPSVYAVIIQNDKVLLSKQWDGYDFPGGGIELGETIEQALIREVKEETGFDIKIGQIVTVGNSFFKFPWGENYVQSILLYYLCEIIGGELSANFLDEHEKEYADKPEWIDLNNIASLKYYNGIDSVAMIHKALKFLDQIKLITKN